VFLLPSFLLGCLFTGMLLKIREMFGIEKGREEAASMVLDSTNS
jgi:hypothetical protein